MKIQKQFKFKTRFKSFEILKNDLFLNDLKM